MDQGKYMVKRRRSNKRRRRSDEVVTVIFTMIEKRFPLKVNYLFWNDCSYSNITVIFYFTKMLQFKNRYCSEQIGGKIFFHKCLGTELRLRGNIRKTISIGEYQLYFSGCLSSPPAGTKAAWTGHFWSKSLPLKLQKLDIFVVSF